MNMRNTGGNRRSYNRGGGNQTAFSISDADLRTIITDPNGAETMVRVADQLGRSLKDRGLTTNQIRALFGEVRQIEGEWTMSDVRERARRRLILLKPKMAYRARRERGGAVRELVDVLSPAVDLVVQAADTAQGHRGRDTLDGNFQRFVEFFEAILAYHKAHGGN